jgi:hypothetical protein
MIFIYCQYLLTIIKTRGVAGLGQKRLDSCGLPEKVDMMF